MRYKPFGRVTFTNPGKHGDKDIRVEFSGVAPTHAELLTVLFGILRAEDRYDQPGQEGRRMLVRLVGEVCGARTWNDAKPIVERAAWSVKNRRAA